MITKKELLKPPEDIGRLQRLEDNLTERARSLIDSLLKQGKLKISSIDFECVYGDVAAEARILEKGRYRIQIGRYFSNAVLNFSIWSAPSLLDHLQLTAHRDVLQEFLYEYWMWLTFHHELNHVTSGHLDFLSHHGLVRYAEIYTNNAHAESLVVPGVDTGEAWWAIESEADASATATSLTSLPLTKHGHLLRNQSISQSISMHGMLVSMYFLMFDRLKSSNDSRHPSPTFRKAICQPSLDKLCRQLQLLPEAATRQMIYSDFRVIEKIMGQTINVEPYFKALNWMLSLDELLEKMDMRKFRKQ
jgi:hypothetical protein